MIKELLKQHLLFANEHIIDLKKLPLQGFCNTNYKLTTSQKSYLVRVLNTQRGREFEYKVNLEAFKLGIAAKPYLLDINNSLMVCEFLEGRHKKKLSTNNIIKIARLLQKLHSIKIQIPTYKTKKLVLCHQDLNPQNFIFTKKDIKLIDWEYAGLNECYFDLTSLIVEFNFTPKEEKLFLNTYFKRGYSKKKLYDFKVTYTSLCIKWFSKRNKQKEKMIYKKRLLKIKLR